MKSIYLSKIREQNPLIHNITNIVAANFSANGLLALGASPLMSANVEEMQEVPKISQALVINIGTLIGKEREAMLLAGKTANAVGIPVVLDPVGVGATSYRRETIRELLAEVKFALIRGNAGELAAIAGEAWQAKGVDAGQAKGVDAGQGEVDLKAVAEKVAQRHGCTVLISGMVDIVSDGTQTATIHNGTPLFPKVTASGCLLSAVCAAFLAVSEGNYFSATLEACVAYTIAGERAAQGLTTQVGQFQIRLLDELAAISPEIIEQRGRINE
ncbi:TPA: hydroxyethylthiazole kinase [Haemophilus influenzae]|uniref:hydroxyethylthiazole kinase n=1 Tax=Haemophilus TaxID=724 RepID=UPI0006BB6D87|nr:hydroxyethylthiazole kinase [Haemophilus influenzae]KPH72058.1 hydroxyethylthiazole kinase [Haemophilus influenzae]MCK8821136.1 hydroxyethylthiazole kinase [Haemophilus influenzae]MCK8881231.1 hydroxyethylthiazole kinase [Haemophilus influenzae]OXS18297.1 hydroxyethylthiazole kinase [Haemophilus influenzae]TWU82337.1 hydroxyethylthiazole kinase [Haemophilus influenzae]